MVQIDNVKMWESLIEGNSVTYENGMVERGDLAMRIINALKDQGLEYKDGEIVGKEEIKGNQREVSPNPSELTEFEKAVGVAIGSWNPDEEGKKGVKAVAKKLLSIARKQIASEIDVDAMAEVKQYIDAYGLSNYRRGIEDTIKKIKED